MNQDQLTFANLKNNLLDLRPPNRAMKKICEKYNYKFVTVHDLRHTHCSLLFEAGRSIKEIQEKLGHKNPELILKVYTHVTESKNEETAVAFEEFMRN
ncbi:hypothetical protein GCM10025886_25990 [Tetragenococcus halophilus subsp. flandriensis]|uniref:tyrosine-type recombinase/integrase n=1 Tax=Tetragenococcus halophilus TaxID=51669 RepID=UPI0023E9833B|nr:tyrosine-type recombinase/integrase [Tetragenococcus halophilus]GMA09446.1 hypothetical protein GCM10025886_25990 [Tetragenococcus halophilus subsp. flandriensis]